LGQKQNTLQKLINLINRIVGTVNYFSTRAQIHCSCKFKPESTNFIARCNIHSLLATIGATLTFPWDKMHQALSTVHGGSLGMRLVSVLT